MTVPAFAFDAHDHANLTGGRREAICDWLTSKGVDPNHVRRGHVQRGAAGYELHLAEYVCDADGRHVLSKTIPNEAEMTERVVPLGDRADWPGAEVSVGDHPGDAASRS